MAFIIYCRDCNQELKRSYDWDQMKLFAEEHAADHNHAVILGLVSSEVISPIIDIEFREPIWGWPFEGKPEELFVDEGDDPWWHNIVRSWEETEEE